MPLNPINPEFSLEKQYQEYLKRVDLSEATMHPTQRIETKRAFMGAVGIMLVMFRDEITQYPDDVAVAIMEDLWTQTAHFWTNQIRQPN